MSTTTDSTDLNIKKNEYVAFDALSLRDFIRQRLLDSGLFTDQVFEGSNLNAINNIIAYSFHTFMFYLNQTSTESMFSEAQLYENMSRVVKLINYAPVGAQTSTLSFTCSAGPSLPNGTYTIPRYSFIRVGNTAYSFNTDVTFTSLDTVTPLQELTDVGNQFLLYQGKYIEYPLYTARGDNNEVVYLIPGSDSIVDHFNIDIYVKDITTGLWSKWDRTESLFLEDATSRKFEMRLNENENYEFKFGDNINGVGLNAGDVVAIYYLESIGSDGEVGVGSINGNQANLYTSTQYYSIVSNVISSDLTLLSDSNINSLSFSNTVPSTSYADIEDVDSIRKNAPATFRSQYRIVTAQDYESFVRSSFANIIRDIKVYNNSDYMLNHLRYLYDIGLTNPGQDYRVLFNQMAFADACNFNNVYLYILPKVSKLLTNNYINYLTPSQKQLIISTISDKKTLTSEVIIMDPVYKAVTIGLGDEAPTIDNIAQTVLTITLDRTTKISDSYIRDKIQGVLQTYFDPTTITLGMKIDIPDITSQILAIDGIIGVTTDRLDTGDSVNGVSLIVWNPSYVNEDIVTTTKAFTVQDFQAVYLNDITDILNRIVTQIDVSRDTAIINI